MFGMKATFIPSFIEPGGHFITNPTDIANHFNYLVIKLRNDIIIKEQTRDTKAEVSIMNNIMAGKNCNFQFSNFKVRKGKGRTIGL